MLRNGRWKYHHYVRHQPELFDLANDPEETTNLAEARAHAGIRAEMDRELRLRCDPEATDRAAKLDQAALIERLGGQDAVFGMGRAVSGGTPPPKTARA
jgi:choline-sulfatase